MTVTVKENDTLNMISERYSVPVEKLRADNGLSEKDTLVVGQSLAVAVPRESIETMSEITVGEISENEGIPEAQLFRNNFFLKGQNSIPAESFVVLSYEQPRLCGAVTGGYAYEYISEKRLESVVNYLTYVMPFTYGFDERGELVFANDERVLMTAKKYGISALMHVSTLTEDDVFDSNLPGIIFGDSTLVQRLVGNIVNNVTQKGYAGADVDFEYLKREDRQGYVDFIRTLSEALHEIDKILVVALPPKTSDEQRGLLYEGIDYEGIGRYADYVLTMTYEWGYRYGPPLAVAPVYAVREVLDYAVTRIDAGKILLGISNYGYDWTLPYVRGEGEAVSIGTVEAVDIARKNRAEILFDDRAQAPYFYYTDEEEKAHVVWFEDARSFEAKAGLICEYNLAGGFVWELMRENPSGYVTLNGLLKIT